MVLRGGAVQAGPADFHLHGEAEVLGNGADVHAGADAGVGGHGDFFILATCLSAPMNQAGWPAANGASGLVAPPWPPGAGGGDSLASGLFKAT